MVLPQETDEFEYDDLTTRMVDDLPEWFRKAEDSNNYKFLEGPGDQLERVDGHIESVGAAVHPQTATTVDELAYLAEMVNISPRENESLAHFRARTIARFQAAASKGTLNDLLNGISHFLNVDVTGLDVEEYPAQLDVTVPANSLDRTNLTEREVAEYGEDLIAPSYILTIFLRGTLEYISPETYDAIQAGNDSWDNHPGYDGVDADGNPKDSGGTYGGIIG